MPLSGKGAASSVSLKRNAMATGVKLWEELLTLAKGHSPAASVAVSISLQLLGHAGWETVRRDSRQRSPELYHTNVHEVQMMRETNVSYFHPC